MIHSTPGTVVKECLITASTAGFCCWFATYPKQPKTAASTEVPIAIPILFPREINAY